MLAISKATEFFLEHLSLKAYEHSLEDAEEAGTIKYSNVVKAQTKDPSCDFLNDLFKYWNPNQDAPTDHLMAVPAAVAAADAADAAAGGAGVG